ncbi:sporozoite protein with an altered thrombospondin repeat SPATR [Toxoplasma gondii ME49]|uniref:Sporozoite protein with an altered thrombospondin repeat SPATR n=8 Tax=Toxoplasma gondii TaxID=5811 RepID=B9PY79_TOXGV|nr:sporozoite protein with an altered thrombospondin repeat SPATR [Toxoplasma gondii ME49]EPR57596.1 sporozoite protein with an altered thrombospondin repeat SPATR [Toxoplasma gondii GT1]ESS29283.1 sporozoite protein with an altered thrombospondin repeat SPATR [Toxoplasma gondii VEG]KAF4646131.1 sporozoite protein with an altered thrombospondin repeat SPATR [Toxoplasma gondii]KFG35704.1 sporozoite protein with an altered thrombospondin repeat SPATR [Toxoplasma gondii p89]KFH14376.1 sporozoite |eukprot:XP_002370190.1 sporozoite protein with an altered thrombospondin repeat SPATR [Toxoplasma gondii ME49]
MEVSRSHRWPLGSSPHSSSPALCWSCVSRFSRSICRRGGRFPPLYFSRSSFLLRVLPLVLYSLVSGPSPVSLSFSPSAFSCFSPPFPLTVAAESPSDAAGDASSSLPDGEPLDSTSETAASESEKRSEDKTQLTEEQMKEKARKAAEAAAAATAKALELGVSVPPLVTASAGGSDILSTHSAASDAADAADRTASGFAADPDKSAVVRADDMRYQSNPENSTDGEHASSEEEEKPIPVDGGDCIIFAAEEGDRDSCSCPEGFVLCNWQDVQMIQRRLARIERAARAAAVRVLLLHLDKLPAEELETAPASRSPSAKESNSASEADAKVGGELRGSSSASGDQATDDSRKEEGATDEAETRLEAMLPTDLAEFVKQTAKAAMSLHAPGWVKTLCDDDARTGFKSYGVQIDYEVEAICKDEGTKDAPAVDFIYELNTYVPLSRLRKLQEKDSSWTPRHCLVADFYLCKRLPHKRKKVNCEMSGWSEWSPECVNGTQMRKNRITRSGQHGGRACVWDGKQPVHAEVTELRSCNQPSS